MKWIIHTHLRIHLSADEVQRWCEFAKISQTSAILIYLLGLTSFHPENFSRFRLCVPVGLISGFSGERQFARWRLPFAKLTLSRIYNFIIETFLKIKGPISWIFGNINLKGGWNYPTCSIGVEFLSNSKYDRATLRGWLLIFTAKVAILFRAFWPKEGKKCVSRTRARGRRIPTIGKERGNKECVPNINWEENVCEFSFSNEGSRRRRRDASFSLFLSLSLSLSPSVYERRICKGVVWNAFFILILHYEFNHEMCSSCDDINSSIFLCWRNFFSDIINL